MYYRKGDKVLNQNGSIVGNITRPKKSRGGLINAIKSIFRPEPVYDTGGNGRRMRGWVAPATGPNAAIIHGAAEMRNRSRDLTRKFPLLNGAYETISANIVGTGVKALPKITDKDQRKIIKDVWDEWCDECDVEGINDFALLLDIAVRQRYEAGEVFIRHRIITDDGLLVPYQLQLLEAEHVPYDMNLILPNGNVIIAGVEYDRRKKRVAYHMYPNHPGDNVVTYSDNLVTVRVPAAEVIHYFKQLRPRQVRGIPEGFSAQAKARDVMIYDEAELAKKQLSSLFAGFIESPDGGGVLNEDSGDVDADLGEAVAKIETGSITSLEPGERITFTNPVESGASYEPFMKSTHRSLAASLNMSYEEFSLDLSGVNFSSIRTGLNQSQRKYRKEQAKLIHMVCKPIWREFFKTAVLAGVFNFKSYVGNEREYMGVQFQPPGWAYVNPAQEVAARKEEVKAGFKSRAQIVAEMGYDVEEVDELIARDNERAKSLGLNFDVTVEPIKNLSTNEGMNE